MENIKRPEYSTLAEIYDVLMKEVDYEAWADFIDEIIQTHHPDPVSILELACGTGSLSLSLDELQCYDILATDKSPSMIRKARQKAKRQGADVRFTEMDFLDIRPEGKEFDIVLSLFDSVNYLQKPEDIRKLLAEVKKVLKPESLFIFDFTTPRNSIKAIQYLHNEKGYAQNHYRFFRKSRYDPHQQIHYNEFNIEKLDKNHESVQKRYSEKHRQRIYTLKEMLDIVGGSGYNIVAKYEDFDLIEATDNSLRITMVLQCPRIQ